MKDWNKEVAKEELIAAFKKAEEWSTAKKDRDPLNGFGKGGSMGDHVLNEMPAWFQRFYASLRWHPVFLIHGWDAFLSTVSTFGLTEDRWWTRAEVFMRTE